LIFGHVGQGQLVTRNRNFVFAA